MPVSPRAFVESPPYVGLGRQQAHHHQAQLPPVPTQHGGGSTTPSTAGMLTPVSGTPGAAFTPPPPPLHGSSSFPGLGGPLVDTSLDPTPAYRRTPYPDVAFRQQPQPQQQQQQQQQQHHAPQHLQPLQVPRRASGSTSTYVASAAESSTSVRQEYAFARTPDRPRIGTSEWWESYGDARRESSSSRWAPLALDASAVAAGSGSWTGGANSGGPLAEGAELAASGSDGTAMSSSLPHSPARANSSPRVRRNVTFRLPSATDPLPASNSGYRYGSYADLSSSVEEGLPRDGSAS